jgi:hypothetical protein
MSKSMLSKQARRWQIEMRRIQKIARANRRILRKLEQDARRYEKRLKQGKIKHPR